MCSMPYEVGRYIEARALPFSRQIATIICRNRARKTFLDKPSMRHHTSMHLLQDQYAQIHLHNRTLLPRFRSPLHRHITAIQQIRIKSRRIHQRERSLPSPMRYQSRSPLRPLPRPGARMLWRGAHNLIDGLARYLDENLGENEFKTSGSLVINIGAKLYKPSYPPGGVQTTRGGRERQKGG